MTEKLTMTVEEAAKFLGISRNTAYEAANAGNIPTIRIGRRILVPISALEKLLQFQSPEQPVHKFIEPVRRYTIRIVIDENLHQQVIDAADGNAVTVPHEIINRLKRSFHSG